MIKLEGLFGKNTDKKATSRRVCHCSGVSFDLQMVD